MMNCGDGTVLRYDILHSYVFHPKVWFSFQILMEQISKYILPKNSPQYLIHKRDLGSHRPGLA